MNRIDEHLSRLMHLPREFWRLLFNQYLLVSLFSIILADHWRNDINGFMNGVERSIDYTEICGVRLRIITAFRMHSNKIANCWVVCKVYISWAGVVKFFSCLFISLRGCRKINILVIIVSIGEYLCNFSTEVFSDAKMSLTSPADKALAFRSKKH